MPFAMTPALLPSALAVASGGVIGLVLGTVGGGGSILAVPLLVYVVGVASPHVAIGTAATAVALNALLGLAAHAKHGTIKWRCALVFAAAGSAGALTGAEFGKAIDGQHLLFLFGLLMIAVGASMLRPSKTVPNENVRLTQETYLALLPPLLLSGASVGLLSGFFGIGGGFLIVPALMYATGMSLTQAAASSLVAVAAFGLTTAGSYAASGYVDWQITLWLIAGGTAGAYLGSKMAARLAQNKQLLSRLFAALVIAVGIYVAIRGVMA